ncbi:MAG: guanylate kinase [Epsilonproteobacteria bacterium]|nr:guanylate kinase [Campylobacterota bacterium]
MNSAILVLSGPSGAGKSTIINKAAAEIGDFYFSVSTTTRAPREGEVEGKDYFFVSKEEFEKGIKNNEFLEYAIVHGNYYGTSLKPIQEALKEGKLVIFDIDVQGHRIIKKSLSDIMVSAFITPSNIEILEQRLKSRSSESLEIIQKRLQNAKEEIKAIGEYDFVILNDDIEEATKAFVAIANAARNKMSTQEAKEFIKKWLK